VEVKRPKPGQSAKMANDRPSSFEERMDKVRERLVAEQREMQGS
jgi:hypothetical protein